MRGSKTRTGDARATVCLSVTLSGKKLDPLIIFKGQPGKTNEKKAYSRNGQYDEGAQYCFQPAAWSDEQSMLKWIDRVLKPYLAKIRAGMSHVLLDDYNSHKTPAVLAAIRKLNAIITILPGGSTSQIQVLDVGVNKPFKGNMKKKWVQFMVEQNGHNDIDITREMLSKWIVEAFSQVELESIKNTWNKIGFY